MIHEHEPLPQDMPLTKDQSCHPCNLMVCTQLSTTQSGKMTSTTPTGPWCGQKGRTAQNMLCVCWRSESNPTMSEHLECEAGQYLYQTMPHMYIIAVHIVNAIHPAGCDATTWYANNIKVLSHWCIDTWESSKVLLQVSQLFWNLQMFFRKIAPGNDHQIK